MATTIRVHRAYMLKSNIQAEEAHVYWEGVHGRRDKTFRDGWGLWLTRLLRKNSKIYAADVEGDVDIHGTLGWDKWELSSIFTLDPENGRDTADVLALLIHES